MTIRRILPGVIALSILLPSMLFAVEAPKPVIVLFNENIQIFIAGTDIASDAGIEAIGATELISSNLPVTNPDKRKSRIEFRIKVKNASTNAGLGNYVPYLDTRAYPNPMTSLSTSYYCEEEDGSVRAVDPTQEGFPCDFEANLGIANSGQTRYLVASLATYAWYENQADGTVDIGQASVTVFDPDSHAKLWRKTWKVTAGDWGLEENLSAVGDYLSGDGVDEVRIVYSRDLPNNAAEMRYTYYDIASGAQIKEHTFTVAGP